MGRHGGANAGQRARHRVAESTSQSLVSRVLEEHGVGDHNDVMPDYGPFARFYDSVMGVRTGNAWVRERIERHMPRASSLLELGCGTGSILAGLSWLPSLTGLDLSPDMLAIVRAKVPAARFIEADMASFELGEQFDVVICVFDTLNHLPAFDDWRSLFARVHEHLAEGGLFIFDVNTVGGLRRHGDGPPLVHDFDGNTMIMNVELAGDGMSVWDVRVFERLDGDLFALRHERIIELGVELGQIVDALSPQFEPIEQTDPAGGKPDDESDRAYFVFRKR
jgi:SAM-dependent methyltransferase